MFGPFEFVALLGFVVLCLLLWSHHHIVTSLRESFDTRLELFKGRVDSIKEENQRLWDMNRNLMVQCQDMAERVASMRENGMTIAPDDKRFAPPEEPQEPMSQQLRDFLDGIESQELRDEVETQIERMREHMPDEIVYENIAGSG